MLITTKYVGPTNTKGSRIRVQCGDLVQFYLYRDDASSEGNHRMAAMKFAHEKLDRAEHVNFVTAMTLDGHAFMLVNGNDTISVGDYC